MADRVFNTVVVGYGFAGRGFHSYLIGLTPGLKLHGVVARSAEARAKAEVERGCRTYETLDAALADPAVDLIVLATPHDTHAPMSIAASRAGKHVVTDKVMCLNLAECDAMVAAAKEAGKLLTVFHNRRWDGDFLTLKSLLAAGRLGDLRWLEMSWMKYGVWRRWRSDPAHGGGRIYDLGAHLLDQALLLFESPVKSVYARIHRDWRPEFETDSHAQVTLAFEDGRTAVIDVASGSRWAKPRFQAVGSAATWVKEGLDPQEAAMLAGNIDSAVDPEPLHGRLLGEGPPAVTPTLKGRWRSFYENVADALAGRAEPAVTPPQMRRLMGVIDAVFESERTGQAVKPCA